MSQFFLGTHLFFLHTFATCSELQSDISTKVHIDMIANLNLYLFIYVCKKVKRKTWYLCLLFGPHPVFYRIPCRRYLIYARNLVTSITARIAYVTVRKYNKLNKDNMRLHVTYLPISSSRAWP